MPSDNQWQFALLLFGYEICRWKYEAITDTIY